MYLEKYQSLQSDYSLGWRVQWPDFVFAYNICWKKMATTLMKVFQGIPLLLRNRIPALQEKWQQECNGFNMTCTEDALAMRHSLCLMFKGIFYCNSTKTDRLLKAFNKISRVRLIFTTKVVFSFWWRFIWRDLWKDKNQRQTSIPYKERAWEYFHLCFCREQTLLWWNPGFHSLNTWSWAVSFHSCLDYL